MKYSYAEVAGPPKTYLTRGWGAVVLNDGTTDFKLPSAAGCSVLR